MENLDNELLDFWRSLNKLNINQLIKNKKAINRPKDIIDVIELEKIKELRGE